jgi:hypothetical protein
LTILLNSTTASENAACFAFFLSQHKTELGRLTIEQVTVFRNDGSGNVDPDLVFHVAAVSDTQVVERGPMEKSMSSSGLGFAGDNAEKHVVRKFLKREKPA